MTTVVSAAQILQRTVGHLRRALRQRGARSTGRTVMSLAMTTTMLPLTRSSTVPGLVAHFLPELVKALRGHLFVGECPCCTYLSAREGAFLCWTPQ